MTLRLNQPNRHHFVPRFYLSAWKALDGRLPTWTKGHKSQLAFRNLSTKSVCFRDRLYCYDVALNGEHFSENFELSFFKMHDNKSADVIHSIIKNKYIAENEREILKQFIIVIIFRSPNFIERISKITQFGLIDAVLNSDIDTLNWSSMNLPIGFYESAARAISVMMAPEVSNHYFPAFDQLKIHLVELDNILTSDTPVVIETPVTSDNGGIAFPLSPKLLILMHNRTAPSLSREQKRQLERDINKSIVKNADRYVFGKVDKIFLQRNWI